jgi:tripartite-type tricarboxylate transporter receptor subunit TctC
MGTMRESKKIIWLFWFLLMYFFIQTPQPTHGAEKYPTRAIKLIVGTGAGGVTDVAARKLADYAGKSLGQEILVENKPGAGGALAGSFLAKSKPDGYTLGALTSPPFIILPFFSKMDFDPIADLTPISQVVIAHNWLMVRADSSMKTFNDFIQEGRKRQLLIAGEGTSTADIAIKRLAVLGKLDIKMVPYGGGAATVTPLLGGHVDALAQSGNLEYVRAGQIRVLARLSSGPVKQFGDVPQVKSFGYDIDVPGFWGFFGPKGLSMDILAKLEEAFAIGMKDTSMLDLIERSGQEALFRNSKDFWKYLKEVHEGSGKTIRDLGMGIYSKENK